MALSDLAANRPELGIDLEVDPQLLSLTQVAEGAELDNWLARTATLAEGIHRKTAAAYLISIFVWKLGDILGAAYLMGTELPALTPDRIAVGQEVRGHGAGRDVYFRFHFASMGAGEAFDRSAFARSIVDLHAPLVAALHRRTGLSSRALWRLVTDGISGGLLAHGRFAGCVARAREEATAILSDPASPLHNRQWRFVEIDVAGIPSEWFRLRGGCCRLYLTAGGDYCTTCVLRSRESQIERLRSVVRGRAR